MPIENINIQANIFNIDEPITQNAHGFVVGDVVRCSDSTANEYVKAQADTLANAKAVGVVSQVVNANEFYITYSGRLTSGVPSQAQGTVMYLSDSVAGAMSTTAGTVEVRILEISENALSAIVNIDFSGGGGGSVASVTGDSVDNTDPANPVVNAIPLAGTSAGPGNQVTGDVEMEESNNVRFYTDDGTDLAAVRYLPGAIEVHVTNIATGLITKYTITRDSFIVESDTPNFPGAQYGADYSADYTNRSLVDKEYVDNQVGDYVPLAGTTGGNPVTGDVEMVTATTRQIFQNGTGTEKAQVILINGVEAVLRAVDAAGNASFISVQGDEIIISSSNAGFEGAKYGADYSANFVARSLVDKDYVDNAVGTPVVPIISLTRAALQALIAGSTLDTTVTYRVTDAVGSTIVVDTWAATNNTLHAAMIDQTNTRFGFYNIVGDAFTEVYEPAFTVLPLASGGTNKNMTAVNGGVVWSDADSLEVTAAGTSGQPLLSSGAAAPTWGTASTGPTDFTVGAAVVGFSSLTTNIVWYNYNPQTKLCTVSFLFNGTSDNIALTFTAPFTSAAIDQNIACVLNTNNGVASTTIGRLRILASQTTVDVGRDRNLAAWTASGTKVAFGTFSYFTA